MGDGTSHQCVKTGPTPPPCEGLCCTEKNPNFCQEKDASAYCGKSDQEFARFTDGSGCSCLWNEEYVNGKCVPKTAQLTIDAEPKCLLEKDFCTTHYGAHAFCGESKQAAAQIPNGNGCSCSWNFVLDGTSHQCVKTGPTPPPCEGLCCTEKNPNFCQEKDASAYCGKSDQEFARFTDGSGCSCLWNEEYVNGKCVPKEQSMYV